TPWRSVHPSALFPFSKSRRLAPCCPAGIMDARTPEKEALRGSENTAGGANEWTPHSANLAQLLLALREAPLPAQRSEKDADFERITHAETGDQKQKQKKKRSQAKQEQPSGCNCRKSRCLKLYVFFEFGSVVLALCVCVGYLKCNGGYACVWCGLCCVDCCVLCGAGIVNASRSKSLAILLVDACSV